jgi:two-component system sensor histidine kinase TctE
MRLLRNPFRSIRGQLLVWLLTPLLIIGLLSFIDARNSALAVADDVSDRVLSGSVLAIAERVFVNDDDELEVDIPYIALQMLTSSEDDRVFYKIERQDGDFITGYRDLALPEPDDRAANTVAGNVQFTDGSYRGAKVRIAVYEGASASNTRSYGYRVAVAETTNARAAIASSIALRSLARQAIIVIGAAIFVWIAVAVALAPLKKIEQAVGRRNPNDVRPIRHRVPSEVSGLVATINALLERFAASLTALQNFTSHASHQFRTPLSLIKTHLDLALREKDPNRKYEAIAKANSAVNDAERLMSQLLTLSRLDAASTSQLQTEVSDLSEVAREVCEEFVLQLANNPRLDADIGFASENMVMVQADKTLVQEVIRNLIDNAIKHAGPNATIDVAVAAGDGYGQLRIRDNGPGFDLPKVEEPADRRLPFPEKVSEGLGLSIVREIVALLNGELQAKRIEGGGMEVSVAFKTVDQT